jgi:hypothetical protein
LGVNRNASLLSILTVAFSPFHTIQPYRFKRHNPRKPTIRTTTTPAATTATIRRSRRPCRWSKREEGREKESTSNNTPKERHVVEGERGAEGRKERRRVSWCRDFATVTTTKTRKRGREERGAARREGGVGCVYVRACGLEAAG